MYIQLSCLMQILRMTIINILRLVLYLVSAETLVLPGQGNSQSVHYPAVYCNGPLQHSLAVFFVMENKKTH